jgi:dTDP-4-dehydrorhamnose reductase
LSRRVTIIGANGQLGQDLCRYWREFAKQDELISLTHADIVVENSGSVAATLRTLRPQLVVNTAAFHKVDLVEGDPERAFAVNSVGVQNLAIACRELDAVLLHVSSDYVFSGNAHRPYVEGDPVDPINVYGVSKASGEMLLRYLWPKHFIVRSSGLYGLAGSSGKGGNFVELMIQLAHHGKPVRVVNDQVLTPTGTTALARQMVALSATEAYGTFHATCQGECSWYEFAAEIFRLTAFSPEFTPQTTAESGARARRPAYSVLENQGLRRIGLDLMPGWRESLSEYIQHRPESSGESTST